MKKKFLLVFYLVSCSITAQIKFEKGYFINNNNEKIECLIKNIGWKNNPDKIEYKVSENQEIKKTNIESIIEFSVGNLKYKKFKVDIDRSSQQLSQLNYIKTPKFNSETLLLKVLTEGTYNLFSYTDHNLQVFFYINKNNSIEQLFYKKYKISEIKIGENTSYKRQLYSFTTCENISQYRLNKLRYSESELVKLFVEGNQCENPNYVYNKTIDKGAFHLTVRPGLNLNSLAYVTMKSSTIPSKKTIDFGKSTFFRIGVETEYNFAFNRGKWSIIFEPTYGSYKAKSNSNTVPAYSGELTYSTLELPFGIRHYFFINDKSKIFLNFLFVPIVDLGSKIEFDSNLRPDYNIKGGSDLGCGIGYNFNNKFSFEYRYFLGRENVIHNLFVRNQSESQNMSFIFGYSIF